MHVTIHTAALQNVAVTISDSAAATVRMRRNPSHAAEVDAIKALAAALISECEALAEAGEPAAREAKIAITQIQGACMFAVAAATA